MVTIHQIIKSITNKYLPFFNSDEADRGSCKFAIRQRRYKFNEGVIEYLTAINDYRKMAQQLAGKSCCGAAKVF